MIKKVCLIHIVLFFSFTQIIHANIFNEEIAVKKTKAHEHFNNVFETKDLVLAKQEALKCFFLSQTYGFDTLIIKSSNVLGFLYSELDNLDSSMFFLKQGVKKSYKIKYNKPLIMSYSIISQNYIWQKKFDSAMIYNVFIDDLYKKDTLQKDDTYANHLAQKAQIFEKLNQHKIAINIYHKLIDSSNCQKCIINISLSEIYHDIYDYNNSKKLALKALKLIDQVKDTRNEAGIYFILGKTYLALSQKDSSLYYFSKNEEVLNRIGLNQESCNDLYLSITNLFFNVDSTVSKTYFNRINRNSIKSKSSLAKYYFYLAKFEKYDNKKILYAEKSLNLISENQNDIKIDLLYYLYSLYKRMNKNKKSLKTLELYQTEKEKINQEKIALEIQSTFAKRLLTNQNNNLKRIYDKKNIRVIKKFSNILLIISLSVFILLILFFLYRKIKKERIKKITLQKDKIQKKLSKILLKKDTDIFFLKKIKQELNLIKNSREIPLILSKINRHVKNIDIIDILDNADQEKKQILSKLRKKTTLTKTEEKVLILVMSGLSSKAIADKLFVTTKSIEMYRYNIRKKFKIPKGVLITEFLFDY
jgi:DNA-binding CsgD family transcriptional regulator